MDPAEDGLSDAKELIRRYESVCRAVEVSHSDTKGTITAELYFYGSDGVRSWFGVLNSLRVKCLLQDEKEQLAAALRARGLDPEQPK